MDIINTNWDFKLPSFPYLSTFLLIIHISHFCHYQETFQPFPKTTSDCFIPLVYCFFFTFLWKYHLRVIFWQILKRICKLCSVRLQPIWQNPFLWYAVKASGLSPILPRPDISHSVCLELSVVFDVSVFCL